MLDVCWTCSVCKFTGAQSNVQALIRSKYGGIDPSLKCSHCLADVAQLVGASSHNQKVVVQSLIWVHTHPQSRCM